MKPAVALALGLAVVFGAAACQPVPGPSDGSSETASTARSEEGTAALIGTWTPGSASSDDPSSLKLRADGKFVRGLSASQPEETLPPRASRPPEGDLSLWRIDKPGVLYFKQDTWGLGTYVARYRYEITGDQLSLSFIDGEHKGLPERSKFSWVTRDSGTVVYERIE